MGTRRSYHDGCGAARALDVIGERWALLVARELLLGPKRFTDVRAGLPGISSNVLTERLQELEDAGVVCRRRLPPPAASTVYELTAWGAELEPIILQLGAWGARSPLPITPKALSVDSLIISFRTMFQPARSDGLTAEIGLDLAEDSFRARVAAQRLDIARGSAPAPDATIRTTPLVLAEVVYQGRDVTEALDTGILTIEGDERAGRRFMTLFALPALAPRPQAA
ncbi:transcriptional regulator [Catellatospora sp. TT07R-123]|uniref:winged helix-turn-helix transcriptional regulator n=1 Tax=Catellatospora sp. TT07R-123 TaxID=2733863 RepID=UPI001B0060AD|nr:winged helix-turn-helix transcriptional regulator [Catellatospora sp. TT07R-123]GHJ44223.1 transcriptional regulator [Catellatospora sp. TT07R-123]